MPDSAQLPQHLLERIRPLNTKQVAPDGEFVLYWMHHAVRDHDHPALDTARLMAEALHLPVLVYQGLGGRHRFNSDRHHTFILQGAREVQASLLQRGIRHVFYLATEPAAPTPLRSLVRRAALVIAEDFPAPPFPRWTQHLAVNSPVAVWAIDCACIVPMQSLQQHYERAYLFREDTWPAFLRRLADPWPAISSKPDYFNADPGFAHIDLSNCDIAELCARCRIDHGIGPVAHTPGGSRAAYHRWEIFKTEGMRDYARLRNNAAIAWPRGVSRMSAYLHHGHVSPLQLARDAASIGGAGAEKWLDEMLIWREMAFNFCFHTADPETLSALPQWAQQSLQTHARDTRTPLDWERLARGQSGDSLWDIAQRSLLIHGELHNNVRMTWGKALPFWTANPQQALDWLIDLNHRYALDGNNPNSYGGLLWCLGGFDRPFKPESKILGTVRQRPTRQHAERLDLNAYQRLVERPATGKKLHIAIIGAGIAGLTAARTLVDHKQTVTVFEKARGPGGRTATRRTAASAFDHGAQYFTVRDLRFGRYVAAWEQAGVVARWAGRIATAGQGEIVPKSDHLARYVGIPGMTAMAKHLASGLNLIRNTRITKTLRQDASWQLHSEQGKRFGPFDCLLIATPAEQASPFVETSQTLSERIATVAMAPCWSLLAEFPQTLDIAVDGIFCQNAKLSWVARNNSKPQRPAAEAWVLHATTAWSALHLDMTAESVGEILLEEFFNTVGIVQSPVSNLHAHRWLYSIAKQPLDDACLWDRDQRLGVCGDWCCGSRVEGAFLSGMAMAGRVLGAAEKFSH